MKSSKEQIREILKNLAYTHSLVVEQMESMIRVLTQMLEAEEALLSEERTGHRRDWPLANQVTFSAEWQGKSCFLGNTLLFWFFERLSRTPNRFVSHEELLDQVWGGDRTTSTIRGVAKRLRDKLDESGMPELSERIDGSETGYYGLIMV